MRRLHLIIIVFLCAFSIIGDAQTYSVNYDNKTVAAMAAAYATGAATESYYNEQVQDILKHYNAAEVATAGIFASKYLERHALTNLGIWSSSTENYYYRRIHSMVADKIMPKIWTVAGMLLKSPQNVLYWGPYLMKLCDDTKTLCYQFESVVTNSTLSFSDIQFLEISEEIAGILKLSEIGGVNFKQILDDLASVPNNLTLDNLTADIENLYQTGVGLATAGVANMSNALLQGSAFHSLFSGKLSAAIDIVDNYQSLWESLDSSIGDTFLGMLGGSLNVSNLFETSSYNLASWATDYLTSSTGQYYTQRWYINRSDSGSETVCSYSPPTDDDSIINGDEWYRISTSDSDYSPTSSERETILQNSESHAGYSRSWVSQMNAKNDGYTYSISYSMSAYVISNGGKQTKKAYAYSITVTRRWSNTDEIYEDVFDSYSMDLDTFKAQMNARLSEYNDNEEGYTYYLGSDSKKYYQATDAAKLQGVETVTISVTCSDGVQLAEGTTSYKCSTCGSSLNAHTKECSMKTTVTDNDLDLSEIVTKLAEAESMISSLESSISDLEEENVKLMKLICQPNYSLATDYRIQYNQNLETIADYEDQLSEWKAVAEECQAALDEAGLDDEEVTDDYYRIPAIMADCKSAFDLTWQSAGSWNGYTYVRTATMPDIEGVITFSATISIARKPKYFMGIKIHRAIVQISWELTSEYTNTQVVEVMTLDTTKSDEEKAKEVNAKISEIAQEYPDCQLTTEYAESDATEDDSDDMQHLLWSSDRLKVAREVDSRITQIFADLVTLEKMLTYRYSFINILKDIAPYVNDNEGRRRTIVEECFDRWRETAKNHNS